MVLFPLPERSLSVEVPRPMIEPSAPNRYGSIELALRRVLRAVQVYGHFLKLGRFLPDVHVDLLTAASSVEPENQVKALLKRDAEILVATPGRLLRLLKMVRPYDLPSSVG